MVRKLINFIELHDFKKILKVTKDKGTKLAFVLGFGSGLRISEIVGYKEIPPLQQSQINLKTHQIKIYGKGGKERVTVTSPWLNETNIKLLPLEIKRRTLQYRINRLSEKVLNRKIGFHVLRHGFANYMACEKNVPLPMVQAMLGHSRLDTTGIYTKSNPKQTIETAWEVF